MRRRPTIGAVLACALLIIAACSEAAPEESASSTTAKPKESVECHTDLLACARHSTIAPLVPETPTAASGEPVVIGMVNQENTPAGSFPELSGAVQAGVEFINTQLGGISGRPLEVNVCNTKFSTEGSSACAQSFVEAGVPAVLGGIDVFGNGIATLTDNGIPFIGGIPVSDLSAKSPTSFQWSGGSWGASVAFADYAITTLKAKRVAIIYADFGSIAEAANYAKTVLDRAGVETQLVPTPVIVTDMSSPLQAAAGGDPDAIFMLTADTGCKVGFEASHTLSIEAQMFYTGACAAPTIIDDVSAEATNGTIFNVEQTVDQSTPSPDSTLYTAVIETYGDGLEPIGAGTVSFRSLMNLYALLVEIGADNITADSIVEAITAKVDEPSFMGHAYTCDHEQFGDLPAMCSPQQVLVEINDGVLTQVSEWIDVGAVYAG